MYSTSFHIQRNGGSGGMRKLIVGLAAVSLLAVTAPAVAQQADPLGLIASGAVIPYVGNGTPTGLVNSNLPATGNQSWIEVRSPVGDNSGAHAFFFDQSCTQGPDSMGLGVTNNGVLDRRIDAFAGNDPKGGLIVIGKVGQDGLHLDPLQIPLHVNMYWINTVANVARMLEPIAIDAFDLPIGAANGNRLTWNPMRSAASFFAPLEGGAFATSIYFVCPRQSVMALLSNDFPKLHPVPLKAATPLDYRIFDTDENFIVDSHGTCDCLSVQPVTKISTGVFDNPSLAPQGTYVEVQGSSTLGTTSKEPAGCTAESEGGTACFNFSFTGYRSLRVAGTNFDIWNRLSNGWDCSLQGGEVGAPVPNECINAPDLSVPSLQNNFRR
jgi:hypothetical protein